MAELSTTLAKRAAPDDTDRAATLLSQALAIADELGLAHEALPLMSDTPSPAAPPTRARFVHEGELWTMSFAGGIARVKDAKGLHDIAVLLGRPGGEVAALDLVTERGAVTVQSRTDDLGAPGHAGEVLDDEARARYKARLDELADELAEAEDLGDAVRGERARVETDALVEQLSSAYGLGGRARKAGDPSERARTTVTRRIREAIGRISDAHPALGRHLQNSIRTGTYCSYAPEQPVDWQL
jgi:hypothetical protein